MTQRFIFGIDVTPRKEYREEIARLKNLLAQERKQSDYFASDRDAYRAKYKALMESTPARDKNGKFAKRKK